MLEHSLVQFLQKHYKPDFPVLLGLSGGPDSLALFHHLFKYAKNYPFTFGIAHVDHGWREESTEEALQLQQLAETMQVPFHIKRLNPKSLSGNLEMAARLERLKFFKELCLSHHYQAVLLAHHAADQAETVLKRILEGSDISHLDGLREINQIDGITLWRPWLSIRKEQILQWLDKQKIQAFEDCTNKDPKFLRSRMRTNILPALELSFGKEIIHNLCHLHQDANELHEFLKHACETHLSNIEKGPWGVLFDFNRNPPKTAYECKLLVKLICNQGEDKISRALLNEIVSSLREGKSNKTYLWGNKRVYVDRKCFFYMTQELPKLNKRIPLTVGTYFLDGWEVTVTESPSPIPDQNWKEAWKGHVEALLPKGDYILGPPIMNAPYPKNRAPISKWWNNAKVPAFLRSHIPVVWQNDRIVHEFLAPRTSNTSGFHIRLSLK